jgi:adenosylcobyric acid synthase
VADIERGGVFAQIAGTWQLLDETDRARGLGVLVNKFRGDLSFFADADRYLRPFVSAPCLGTLPHRDELQPESEDSLCREAEESETDSEDTLAWIRFPHLSNSQDAQPWLHDRGISVRWITRPAELRNAKAIVLPGSKNTLADLEWLRAEGLDREIAAAAQRGVPVIGICGGYQMLGERLHDANGLAGEAGDFPGLGLLPVETSYMKRKEVRQVDALWADESWTAYEIHMGQTRRTSECDCLLKIRNGSEPRGEGARLGNVWGTYLHGLFESPGVRQTVAHSAGLHKHCASAIPWRARLQEIYAGMADLLEEYLNLDPVWRYVEG